MIHLQLPYKLYRYPPVILIIRKKTNKRLQCNIMLYIHRNGNISQSKNKQIKKIANKK